VIFVTIGSYEPFDRLLAAVGALLGDEPIIAQCGGSRVRPVRASCVEFMPFDDLVEHVRRARAVITHAGVGSVLTVLANGKRPIVVPRLKRFGEAVDDHQLAFARRLSVAGAVVLVEDPAQLEHALAETPGSPPVRPAGGALADELRAYLAATVSRR
jgi:beta-1,4-N-acetylglucosaminyltransferase